MSHIAQVEIEVTNLDDLQQACQRLGLELVRGQQTYRWFGQSVGDSPLPDGFAVEDLGRCDHAIRVSAAKASELSEIYGGQLPYEIGVVRRRDGKPGYVLFWDFWCQGLGLESVVGAGCGRLRQAYGICAARRTAVAQGFSVSERSLPNGSVQLICNK